LIALGVNTRPLKALNRDLQRLAIDIGSHGRMREPLLKAVKNVVSPSILENFDSGGRPPWPAVQADSSYRKGKRGAGPLVVTGALRRAAGAHARWHVAANKATYGNFPSSRWFAGLHDQGNAHLPQRAFALLQPEDQEAVGEIFMEWLEKRVNAHIRRFYG
jgi:phage gpG-like protein